MGNEKGHTRRLAGKIVAITMFISFTILIIGSKENWNEPLQFSNGFFYASALILIFGILSSNLYSPLNNWHRRANIRIKPDKFYLSEQIQKKINKRERYNYIFVMTAVSGLLLIISLVIPKLP